MIKPQDCFFVYTNSDCFLNNLSITGDIERTSLHIANDLLLFIFIRVVHSGLPFVIQNGDNQGICKKRHGGAIYGIASVTIFVEFLQISHVHKNFTCNLAGYRLHFTHSNLIWRIRKSMRKKWIFTGAAFALAMTMTGCRDNAASSIPQQSSQEQTQMIPMEEAQEAALKAADIEAADADISATTLSEVAGVACYKVEFTSGEYAYAYTINAQTGAVMEMSSQEQNAQASGTQTETADPAAPAPAQNATGTGTVDEAAAQKIALEHAGVKAADATITKSKLDYEDGRQVYDIEWYAGGAKYDYEIAADTGEIISSAYEEKTMGADSKNVTVSEADAKKTALDRVSGATDKDLYEWKLDYDDGRPEYEGKIIYGGTEYEFTIDAATGSVMEWDAEKVR